MTTLTQVPIGTSQTGTCGQTDALEPSFPATLVGRGLELVAVDSFIDRGLRDGGALLLSGEHGVGKTSLMRVATERASALGARVLRASGAEFEVDVKYAALNQLLLPLLDELDLIDAALRSSLAVALRLSVGPTPEPLMVGNATFALLRCAAKSSPLLIVLDDVQWLDAASATVLASVARRLHGVPVGLLCAGLTGADSCFERAVSTVEVPPLDDESADFLLGERFPTLHRALRRRVLVEASGNPVALLELPKSAGASQRASGFGMPLTLPLSKRVEALFKSRISALPASARELLLIAVLHGSGDVSVLEAANPAALSELAPAERAHLIEFDTGARRLSFCHPLTRSAVVSMSTAEERRRAHVRLADISAADSARRAWHLAAATSGPDDAVASLLVEAANVFLGEGHGPQALEAMIRAAELSSSAGERGSRLGCAANLARFTSGAPTVAALLAEARRTDSHFRDSLLDVSLSAWLLINEEEDVETAHRVVVSAMERHARAGSARSEDVAVALHVLLATCVLGGRDEMWASFDRASGLVGPGANSGVMLVREVVAGSLRRRGIALSKLTSGIEQLRERDEPHRVALIGAVADVADRVGECRSALWRIVRTDDDSSVVAHTIDALDLLSRGDLATGRWDKAKELATRASDLCEVHGFASLMWRAWEVQALVAALRGDSDRCTNITDALVEWAERRRASYPLAAAHHVRCLVALGCRDFESAYRHATAVATPGIVPAHGKTSHWASLDLVEAAVGTGRHGEAAAHVAALVEADVASISPLLALFVGGSIALIASESDVRGCFEEAIASSDATQWPFELARIHLLFGERLRRSRAKAEARSHLMAALETFDRLDARPWVARAASQLRATGVGVPRAQHSFDGTLTAHEFEVARLAASGLTNKDIGKRLGMSHRTAAAHLYRVFPKLGLTSRAGLRDALAANEAYSRARDHAADTTTCT